MLVFGFRPTCWAGHRCFSYRSSSCEQPIMYALAPSEALLAHIAYAVEPVSVPGTISPIVSALGAPNPWPSEWNEACFVVVLKAGSLRAACQKQRVQA